MNAVVEFVCTIASVLLLCIAMCKQPRAARCPSGWFVHGIRPSGYFECLRVPGGDPEYDGTWGRPDRSIDRLGFLRSRIYCTNGTHPVVVLEDRQARTVGCQR